MQGAWYYDKSNAWYYLNDECKMVRGNNEEVLWLLINGDCYAFGEDGKMYANCVTPDGWNVDESGVWIR